MIPQQHLCVITQCLLEDRNNDVPSSSSGHTGSVVPPPYVKGHPNLWKNLYSSSAESQASPHTSALQQELFLNELPASPTSLSHPHASYSKKAPRLPLIQGVGVACTLAILPSDSGVDIPDLLGDSWHLLQTPPLPRVLSPS